jgi:hypothetical protein
MNAETENDDINAVILQKLTDADIPGFRVEFDPEEAELLGAFEEDALDEQDALDGSVDLYDGQIELSDVAYLVVSGGGRHES